MGAWERRGREGGRREMEVWEEGRELGGSMGRYGEWWDVVVRGRKGIDIK